MTRVWGDGGSSGEVSFALTPSPQRPQETGEGEELNVAASPSVWGGIRPALNIAAERGRHREKKVIYVF